VHQGAATQGEKQHPDEIPVHIVSHGHFKQRTKICVRSCRFHLFNIEIVVCVKIGSSKSNDGYFQQRRSMLRFGSHVVTPEGRKAKKVAME